MSEVCFANEVKENVAYQPLLGLFGCLVNYTGEGRCLRDRSGHLLNFLLFSLLFCKKKIIAPRANQRTLIGENDLHLRSSYQLPRLGHRPLKDC